MNRQYSLKKHKDFNYVYRRGKSVSNKTMVLYCARGYGKEISIGISVSKKIGGAVVRNKVKRRIKESMRKKIPYLKTGKKIIIIARNPIVDLDFLQIDESISKLIVKSELAKNNYE